MREEEERKRRGAVCRKCRERRQRCDDILHTYRDERSSLPSSSVCSPVRPSKAQTICLLSASKVPLTPSLPLSFSFEGMTQEAHACHFHRGREGGAAGR